MQKDEIKNNQPALEQANVIRSLPTDEQVNQLRDDYMSDWRSRNPDYPEGDYWSGVNDGLYLLLKFLKGNGV